MPTTYVPFGIYLGLTIIENVPGATWDFEEEVEYLTDLKITIKQDEEKRFEVYPFRRIIKFWQDRTDGIQAFFQIIQMNAMAGDIVADAPDGEWIKLPNGTMFRVQKMTKEEFESGKKPFEDD